MNVLIVTFRLDGMSEEEYSQACEEVAPLFTAVAGLVAKVWLADPATNAYGGGDRSRAAAPPWRCAAPGSPRARRGRSRRSRHRAEAAGGRRPPHVVRAPDGAPRRGAAPRIG